MWRLAAGVRCALHEQQRPVIFSSSGVFGDRLHHSIGDGVKAGALVGIGAIVLEGAVVGEGAIVGSGALVPAGMKVPAGMLVLGQPAKAVRELRPEEGELVLDQLREISAKAKIYMAE